MKPPIGSFNMAAQFCKERNSTLLTYENMAEYDMLTTIPQLALKSPPPDTTIFLGLQYNRITRQYVWADGRSRPEFISSASFDINHCRHWERGPLQETMPNMCCAEATQMPSTGKFKMVPCTRQKVYAVVCKQGPATSDEPSPPAPPPPAPVPNGKLKLCPHNTTCAGHCACICQVVSSDAWHMLYSIGIPIPTLFARVHPHSWMINP